MIPKEIKYNLHYDDVRGEFLAIVIDGLGPKIIKLATKSLSPKIAALINKSISLRTFQANLNALQ